MISRILPNYNWSELFSVFLNSQGSVVQLEELFRQKTLSAEAIAFRYGRSGLYYLLKALGIKNKKVVLPSYTCVVVAHAIVLSGNEPVFVDSQPNSPFPSVEDYLQKIDSETCMVIPTYIFGMAMDGKSLTEKIKSQRPDIFVLQDCAHSFFIEDGIREPLYSLGDGAMFGMNISKLINSVKGGMLTLKDPTLATKIRDLRKREEEVPSWQSRVYVFLAFWAFTFWGFKLTYQIVSRTKLLSRETDYYEAETVTLPLDFRKKMNSFEASIGISSFHKFDQRAQFRRKIARAYFDRFKDSELAMVLPKRDWSEGDTWSHFPILVPAEKRDKIVAELSSLLSCQIGTIVDYSVADLPAYQGYCPNANQFAKQVINLPLGLYEVKLKFLKMNLEDLVERIFQFIKQELKNERNENLK